MSKPISILVVAALGPMLGACGDEPSETAMRDAIGRDFARRHQQQAALSAFVVGSPRNGTGPQAPAITAFRKIGCVASDRRPAHQCEFAFTMNNGAEVGPTKAWFYKAESGLFAISE